MSNTWLRDILLLTIGIVILFGSFLGSRPLAVPDEGRYAEIPREMLATGDFTTPRLNAVKYFEKPPLFYWIQAGSLKLLGENEWSARLPNMLMALIGCLATYAAGRRLYNRQTGLIASIILASNMLYFSMAHVVTLDMTVSTFLSVGLFAFICATEYPPSAHRRWLLYTFYICAAFATLTKGLIGIVFPAMIIGVWIVLRNDWRLLKNIYLFSGIFIFLTIAVPWHVLVQIQNPEFANFYFIHQHFLRYLTNEAKRYQPFWFWIPMILLGFLPWTAFFLQSLYRNLTTKKLYTDKNRLFLLLWFGLIFIFFSFSNSKLIPYILPIFPPLAVLIGQYLAEHWQRPTFWVKSGYYSIPITVLAFNIVGATYLYTNTQIMHDPNIVAIRNILGVTGLIWLLGTTAGAIFFAKKYFKTAFALMAFSSALAFTVPIKDLATFDTRTIKPLTETLRPLLKSDDEVAALWHYYQDLPFYLARKITVVEAFDELTFGTEHQDTSAWMINAATFWQRWNSHKRIFMITSMEKYERLKKILPYHFYVVDKTTDNVLLVNHP